MAQQPGFWDFTVRVQALPAHGDPLEKLAATVDFEMFRADLIPVLGEGDPANTASAVRADRAYRSEANEDHLEECGKVGQIHRKKPRGKPMPDRTARANAQKSSRPRPRRARLRLLEGSDETDDPHHRPGVG